MRRNVSLDEFDVPDVIESPTAAGKKSKLRAKKTSSKRISSSKATDLDAVIALNNVNQSASAENSGKQRANQDASSSRDDPWHSIEIEFKPQSPQLADDSTQPPLAQNSRERFSSNSDLEQSFNLPTSQRDERRLRYLVQSSESFNSDQLDDAAADSTRDGGGSKSTVFMTPDSHRSVTTDVSRSAISDMTPTFDRTAASNDSMLSASTSNGAPNSVPNVSNIESKSRNESNSSSLMRSGDDVSSWRCDVCSRTNSGRRTCETCGTTRSRDSVILTNSIANASDVTNISTSSTASARVAQDDDKTTPQRRRSLKERQNSRSVIYLPKKVYDDEGLVASSSQTGDISTQQQQPQPDAKQSFNTSTPKSKLNHDTTDLSGERAADVPAAATANKTAVKRQQYVQKETSDVFVVERAKTPATIKTSTPKARPSDYDNVMVGAGQLTPLTHARRTDDKQTAVMTPEIPSVQASQRAPSPASGADVTSPVVRPGDAAYTRNAPKREPSILTYRHIRKYDKHQDLLQSDKKLKAASMTNLLQERSAPSAKSKSSSQLEVSDAGQPPLPPDAMTRNTPARIPLKSTKRYRLPLMQLLCRAGY